MIIAESLGPASHSNTRIIGSGVNKDRSLTTGEQMSPYYNLALWLIMEFKDGCSEGDAMGVWN